MAESNKIVLGYAREANLGVNPSGTPITTIPWVGGPGIQADKETTRSAQVRTDAQLADIKEVGQAGRADFNFELEADTYDDFLRSLIRADADWSTAVSVSGATDIAAAATGNKYTSTTTDFTAVNITAGQWIYVTGFTEAANNGWKRVSAVTDANNLAIDTAQSLTTEAAGDSITMAGQQITNGSTLHSYVLQQQYADLTNRWHRLTGARAVSASLVMPPSGIIQLSLGFAGLTKSQQSAHAGNGSANAAASKTVASEVDGFEAVYIDGAAISYDVFELGLDINLAARPRKPLGSKANTRINVGGVDVRGNIRFELDDDSWAYEAQFLAHTKFKLAFSVDMGSNERYLIELPGVQYTEAPTDIGGIDQDTDIAFSFGAEPGGSFGASSDEKTIIINRV